MSDVLSPESEPGRKMTLEEWMDLPEDVPGELVDGHLVEEEMPDYPHEVVVAWLIEMLAKWCRPLGGLVAASGVKFAVSSDRGRMPDLTVVLPDRPGASGGTPPSHSPPTIAVEVVSRRPQVSGAPARPRRPLGHRGARAPGRRPEGLKGARRRWLPRQGHRRRLTPGTSDSSTTAW